MTPGKRGMTGKHGNHWRRPLVERVAIICEVCGTTKLWLPSQARRRTGRFCSQACRGKAVDKRVDVSCARCGVVTRKSEWRLARQAKAYCSPACAQASKRKVLPKWPRKNRTQNIGIVAAKGDREAQREYMRRYVAKNRARLNAKAAEWGKKNRAKRNELQRMRRAAYKGSLTEADWQAIKRMHGFKCLRCQKPESLLLTLTPDHVVALARGGAHAPANIQPLCGPCNSWKGARTIDFRNGIHIQEITP